MISDTLPPRETTEAARAAEAAKAAARQRPRLLPTPGNPIIDLAIHQKRFGPLPYLNRAGLLIDEVRAAGLTGRGGAAFPVHRKLAAVLDASARGRGRPVVVANGAEGEPASAKDKSLLLLAPHLVLDGLQLAAETTGAPEGVLYAAIDRASAEWLTSLIVQRAATGTDRVPVRLVEAPARFLAGQESALASRISGGQALPAFTPPRVFERGVDGRPTLVQNVETLAHLSLIARYGAAWFREAGTAAEPGTLICTLRQASGRIEITETAFGTRLSSLLDLRGAGAVLVGGYHGAWLPTELAAGLRLSDASLRPYGATVGAGVLAALPLNRCGLTETARVARYLALESAGQCGPCRNGLPRIAAALAEIAIPSSHQAPALLADLQRWSGLVQRRGACAHPDGTVRFVASALSTFSDEIDAHRRGHCTAPDQEPFLPAEAAR
ncbi:MAG TPA: NADH-ubiquinone oxidoreductase-F iron-sulfur binding region domain-containing protein [Streptosporangiaceae bacterium]|nr:NADH-ubiquinone oxidoreductase-F iron-sulfur binding region domain-containing protein [Streptosporangiaceae bacterium]